LHRFQEYLWTDEIALQIIMPLVEDGLQCKLCFFCLPCMQRMVYGGWNKPQHILPLAAEVIWGHWSQKMLQGVEGPWDMGRNCRTIDVIFILMQCEE